MSPSTVSGHGPQTASLAIVGQAPAAEEIRLGVPFIGRSGQQLNQALAYAGIKREDVYVDNVVQRRLGDGETIFTISEDERKLALTRLKSTLSSMPNLRVVVPLGEDAFWSLTGLQGITKWRGSVLESSLLPGIKAVPSVHPAWIIRGQWVYRTVLICDLERAKRELGWPEIRRPTFPHIIGPSFEQACDTLLSLDAIAPLSIDIELHRRMFIACMSFANNEQPAICVPFCYGDGAPIWTPGEETQLWQIIAQVCVSSRPKVGQNLPFDIVHLLKMGILMRDVWLDTMTAHHCDRVEMPHTLAFMVSIFTDEQFYKDEGRFWHPKMGHDQFWLYNIKDAYWTLQIALELEKRLQGQGLWDFYQKTYIRDLPLRIRMEWEGVRIDTEKRSRIDSELTTEANKLQAVVDQRAGYSLNVRSSKQLQKYLYSERGHKVRYNRSTGRPTIDKMALASMATKDPTIADIVRLRSMLDLLSDVIHQPLDDSDHIHCHYSYAETLRWTSSESVLGTGTNLQNIPRQGPARGLFVPDQPGQVFLTVDAVQAEAMVVAWAGPVPGLKALFESGGDVHLEVAKLVNRLVRSIGLRVPHGLFMSDPNQLTKKDPERQIMKHAVHGSNYEMGRKRFAETAAMKGDQIISDDAFTSAAMRAQDFYHQLFPEVRSCYHKRIQDSLNRHHMIETFEPFMWRRHFHGPVSDEIYREGYAFVPQFMVAMVINELLRRINPVLWPIDSCVKMQIHDEGVIQTWPDRVREVTKIIQDAYDIDLRLPGGTLRIPLAFKVGPTLALSDLEDYKP